MPASFWVHTSSCSATPLDGRGFPTSLGQTFYHQDGERKEGPSYASAKVTVWADKDGVLAFCRRSFKGVPVRDLGDRIELDLPALDKIMPGRTLAFTLVQIP